jgi:hypothetical protein
MDSIRAWEVTRVSLGWWHGALAVRLYLQAAVIDSLVADIHYIT